MSSKESRRKTYIPMPEYKVWAGGPVTSSAITFSVIENGTSLPPVEINYKDTLGWNDGDPRVAGFTMLAKLTNTPEFVRNVTLVAAKTMSKEETQTLTMEALCQRVLLRESFVTLNDISISPFMMGDLMKALGFSKNLFDTFSRIAGNGKEEDVSFAERVSALQAINSLIHLRSPILKAAVSAFREGIREWLTQSGKHTIEESFSPALRSELTQLQTDAIKGFRTAEQRVRVLGITKRCGMTDEDVTKIVFAEVDAGIYNLNIPEHGYQHGTEIRKSSAFIHRDGESGMLKNTIGNYTQTFPGWSSSELTFVDDSIVTMRNYALKCPFPHFARS